MSETGTIVQIARARRFLAEAKDLTDIKAVRDMAEAARLYARAAGLGQDAMNEAAEIKLRAERKAGEALAAMEKQHGARTPQRNSPEESRPPRLTDIGITPKQSMNWQAEASLPEPVFEQHITETKAAGDPLTTAGVVRLARGLTEPDPGPSSDVVSEPVPVAPESHSEPPAPAEVPSTARMRDAYLRSDFLKCNRFASQLVAYAPERIAEVLPLDDADAVARTLDRLAAWRDQFTAARAAPLRVVGGES